MLRTHKLGEADRILTLLGRRSGRVRAVAKGVRRTSSRWGARLEPFMVADVQLHSGRSLDIVQQAESLATYGAGIAADYERYIAACAMAEAAERLTDTESSPEHFLLLVGGLRALAQAGHAPRGVLDSYLVRALAISGWAPGLDRCARCGTAVTEGWFLAQGGGVLCAACAPAGAARADADTVRLLRALLAGQWEVIDTAADQVSAAASGMIAAYAQWQLERGIRSLSQIPGRS